MTETQQDTLEFVKRFISENGYSPSFQEIADNYGITVRAAYIRLTPLRGKHIEWADNKSRTMRLI